jgi:1-deoxy-D-xylulose-5-phosphate reductoisomerase
MGYKNSIDSSTLANKCLELVEAHYLFDIPYENLKIIIHPEAVIHSIVDCKNLTSIMNYFYPDMFIPIYNFLNFTNNIDNEYLNKKFEFNQTNQLNFYKVDKNKFPLFNVFDQIDKNSKIDVIKFNCSNEIAVNLFKFNKIKYNQIHQFIDNSLSLDFNNQVNSINDIVEFQHYFKEIVLQKNEII